MTETLIHVGGTTAVDILDANGWTQGSYDNDGLCLHGVIRRCQPVPGDAHLVEQVESHLDRWTTGWNDRVGRTAGEVRALLAEGWDITDADLAATFGPQWRAVVALVRRAAVLTEGEARRLAAAWAAAGAAARVAAPAAAWDAAWGAAWGAARVAAWGAAGVAAGDAARVAAGDAARVAARVAATWDLATDDGPYTFAHRDLLVAPWAEVCGLPDGLLDRAALAQLKGEGE